MTVAIVTVVMHEHDFINPWLEYHTKIGVDHFYILVDNSSYQQKEYFIEDDFSKMVTFIYLQKQNFDCKMSLIHNSLNTEIILKNIIKEEWTTVIAIDQYLCLKSNTISNYLSTIDDDCTQIIFPWSFSFFNKNDTLCDNFLKNIHSYHYTYGNDTIHNGKAGHCNGLIRTKNMHTLHNGTHHFLSKTATQKVYIINEYFLKESHIDQWSLFDIIEKKMSEIKIENINIHSFHFILRNINETYIKDFFYWKKEEDNNHYYIFENTARLVKTNKYTCLCKGRFIYECEQDEKICKVINTDKYLLDLKVPELKYNNSNEHYSQLIMNELKKFDITREEFDQWKNNTFNT
jgi:hypothetical protein